MASFELSRSAPKSRYRPSSGAAPDFTPQGLKSAGVRTNAASAADTVNTSSIYGSLRDNSPKAADIAVTAAANRMKERVSAEQAEAKMMMAGLDAKKNIQIAEHKADYYDEQAAAAEKGGMMSAMGGIASSVIGLAFSDETTKNSIVNIDDALETLRQLRPVSFFYDPQFTDDVDRSHNGFIAQEYQKILPDATYEEPHSGKLCIDTRELIALNVRAIQQLEERIKVLEAKL